MQFDLLIIGENRNELQSIRNALSHSKNIQYDVTRASTLQKAIPLLNTKRFDAILFSFSLAEPPDFKPLEKLTTRAESIPIIVLLNSNDEKSILHALQTGAQDYLIKGEYSPDSLLRSVRYTIERGKAENTIRESEEKFRLYVESSNEAIFLETPTGEILDCNSAACDMFGYSRDEMLRLTVRDIVSEEVARNLPEVYTEKMATGKSTIERENKRKDGTCFPAEITTKIIHLNGATRVLAYVRDISHRKQSELALRTSEKHFRLITETSKDIVFQMDTEGIITYCSPALWNIIGYKPEEVLGKHFSQFYHKKRSNRSRKNFVKLIQDKPAELLTVEAQTKNGRSVPLEINASPIIIDEEFVGIQGVARDISERVKSQKQLEESENQYRKLFDNLVDVYYRTDVNGKITLVSPSVYELLGYTPEEAIGMDLAQDIYADPNKRAEFLEMLTQKGHLEGHEVMLRRKDGTRIWVSTNVQIIRDENGKAEGVEGLTRDISARKKMEQEIEQRARLDKAIAEISRYFLMSDNPDFNIVLKFIGAAVGVSRASIFEFTRNNKKLNNTFEWSAPGVVSQIDNLQEIDTNNFPWWMERMYNSQNVLIEDVETMPAEAAGEQHILREQEIKAMIAVPIQFTPGRVEGFIGLAEIASPRRWNKDEVQHIQMLGEMIGTQWEQQKTKHLSKAFSELGRKLNNATIPEETAQIIVQAADDLIGWDAASLDLYSSTTDIIEPILSMDTIYQRKQHVPHVVEACAPSPMIRKTLENGSQLILRDKQQTTFSQELTPFGDTNRRSGSLIFVPLIHKGNTIGILSIQSYEYYAYDQEDVEILSSLADHCAGALERTRAEKALVASENEYRQIIRSMQEGFFQIDSEGFILKVNPSMIKILEATSENEVIGKKVQNFHFFQEGSHDFFLDELLKKGRVVNFDNQWITQTGRKIYVRKSAHVVRDQEGEVLYYEGTISDITEQKELEKQLLHAQKMESMGHLAAGIAHDFNNVMATISGAQQMIGSRIDTNNRTPAPSVKRYLKMIESSIERGKTVTDRMLTFTRTNTPNFQPISAMKYLGEIAEIASHTLPKRVQVHVEPYAHNDRIIGDKGQLQQILMNLCMNASDAMPDGGQITLSLRKPKSAELFTHEIAPDHSYLCIEVKDTGIGMDPETQRQIFDPFFTTKAPGKGTGLGLSVVYKIVENHNGWIDLESEPGKGTIFTIGMPLVQKNEQLSHAKKSRMVTPGRGEYILVVDDETSIRDLLVDLLVSNNYTVSAASNGENALEIIKKKREDFDLVITDLGLPKINGIELARIIHKMQPTLPVIGSTGYIHPEEHKQLASNGFHYVLQKPFKLDEVLEVVTQVFTNNSRIRVTKNMPKIDPHSANGSPTE